jgi:hypothetical protein
MLTDSDIGQLFAQMQAAYGHQWAHKSDAMPMWKRALGGFQPKDVFNAVGIAVKQYPDFPPSLGQFTAIASGPPPRPNTYLPGPNVSRAQKVANHVLLQVLIGAQGVDKFVLENLVAMKNALVEEYPDMTTDDVADVRSQLTALAKG